MPYATVFHVEALDQGRDSFTNQTKPAVQEVINYLHWTAAELDGIIAGQDYVLPVATTATSALRLLEGYNAIGANCLVQRAAQSSAQKDEACAAWQAAKEALATADLGEMGVVESATVLASITDNPGPEFDVGTVMIKDHLSGGAPRF